MIRDAKRDGLTLTGAGVVVVGGARTGMSAARFLIGRGCRVTLTDMSDLPGKEAELSKLRDLGVVTDLFGKQIYELRAPFAGEVLYIIDTPPISAGEPLAFIGSVKAN